MDGQDERQVKKSRNWMGTKSLLNPIHRELSVNTTGIGVHSSNFDLIGHEDMPRFKCGEAKFGAEVAGGSKRNRRIATKPRRPKLEPMHTHQGSHAYASRPWAARLFGRTDTYAYTLRASMRTHRSTPASINRGAIHHFQGSPLPHLA
ncbi:hypothetical protein PIB30_049609 [Stylosanthes scabra]|uniref:Uncharacterized protein n=1 Tax=Stylosanthes scabra TaxID=79078 RepID=A0ABU6XI98_9FABA|nr:hypothetical protein [Stylosanthes scabra]